MASESFIMKKQPSKHGKPSYIGTFFLSFISIVLISSCLYGIIYPGTKIIPEPWSSRIMLVAFLIASVAVVIRMLIHFKVRHHSKSTPDIQSYSSYNTNIRRFSVEDQLMEIDHMKGHDFEYWCASLLCKIGFINVEVTQGSGDQGVDILAMKDGIRYAIQCKCYSKDLGNGPVQEVSAGKMMPQYHCQVGAVMTNRYFTKGAQELAVATGTLLWDRDWIKQHLQVSGSVSSFQYFTDNRKCGHNQLLEDIMDDFFRYDEVSVSYIQRRFGLDFEYATFIMEMLEEHGFIVQPKGGHSGYVKISYDMWQKVKGPRITK